MSEGAEPVREAVRAYAAAQPTLVRVTEGYIALLRTLLDDAGIDYLSVTGRTKSVASFAAKATRTQDGRPAFGMMHQPFTGERFTPECVREIWYEHWHRYAFALHQDRPHPARYEWCSLVRWSYYAPAKW